MKSKIEIKKLVGNDPMEALTYLETVFAAKADKQTLNLILLLQSQYNELKKVKNEGTISAGDANMTLNQIKLNIFSIIDDTPDEDFKEVEPKNTIQGGDSSNLIFLEILKLIRELTDFNIELSKHFNAPNYLAIGTNMNTKREVVLNQLIKLIRISNFELSVPDYKVIGDAFFNVFDYQRAEEYYQNAIAKVDAYTDSSTSKVNAIRTYAGFLYNSGRPDEAFKQLETAILQSNSEVSKLLNGYTCALIFFNEANVSNFDNALDFYKKALQFYKSISNSSIRNYWLIELENNWQSSKASAANLVQPK
jgi:tetratricopeptide (TPR) repeat protein